MLNGQSIIIASIGLIICLISAIYKIWRIKKAKSGASIKRVIMLHLFIAYVCAIFAVTLFPILIHVGEWSIYAVNVIPGRTIISIIKNMRYIDISIANTFGNALLFLPFGLLVGLLFKRCQKWSFTLLVSFLFSLFIEVLQLVEGLARIENDRAFDIDDILLNIAGAAIGFLIYRAFFYRKKMNLFSENA
jgi:Glycopeptide antibiotics resistance protein